jgi:hypothetical protein
VLLRRLAAFLLTGAVLLLAGCAVAPQVRTLNHSPSSAASVAQRYVDLLVVQQNVDAAYALVDTDARARISSTELKDAVTKAPGYGLVTSIQATEYQPVPGQPAIDIFLTGSGGGATVYYVVRLSGTADKGYQVNDLGVQSEPYPATALRDRLQ